jgi:deazaflavin-dependent oxidoreductase (nitroreductase family)
VTYQKPPLFVRSVFNRIAMATGISGTMTLITRGRHTGEQARVPVIPVDHGGATYVVSTRGDSDWVRNVRATGTLELAARGRPPERYRAAEVPVDDRPPVIAAYRAKAGRTVEVYWRKRPEPADHPTFRLEPESTS